jgi:alginate O-acetyltransferase complex protein AlgI
MVFSSTVFLFLFLPAALFTYYAVNFLAPSLKNLVLVLFSILFYAWGAPNFLMIFLINIIIDYFLTILMDKAKKRNVKKMFLIAAIAINLGILIYFKYTNYFEAEFNWILHVMGIKTIVWTKIILPIGISFFIFHKISYVVDIYREREKPFYNIIDYALYLMFFPQLIAGPIVRFHEIAYQIKERLHTSDLFLEGIWRFSIGLGKKIIIANTIGAMVDTIFNFPSSDINMPIAWIGMLMYALQIYFDFSGYSDMAIGIGKMFGFNLPENFNRPYVSKSITEFWRRWHMSLSRFFKDYLYIPLGGNRCSKTRNYLNLIIVFTLTGFWHGANTTFLIWGVYYGILIVIEKAWLLKKLENFHPIISNLITFFFVLIGWAIFRSENMEQAISFIGNAFSFNSKSLSLLYYAGINNKIIFITIVAILLSFINFNFIDKISEKLKFAYVTKGSMAIIILIYSYITLSSGSFNPFIYFRF